MLALLSLLFAVLPMVAYLWLIWLMDRYDREPVGLLAANFLWGGFGAVILAVIASIVGSIALDMGEFLDAVILAPVVEEPAKALFLIYTVRSRHFDNVTDGLVYGMAVGLGFGMTENFLYFLSASTMGEWLVVVVVRTLFSAVMHAMATGIVGAFAGWVKFRARASRFPLLLLGLALAVGMHSFWNFAVSADDPAAAGLGLLFIALSVVVILAVMQISLGFESRMLRKELQEEADSGLIPDAHINFIPFTGRRGIRGWLPMEVDRKMYLKTGTRLAFRKSQARCLEGSRRALWDAEIDELRMKVAALLNSAAPQGDSAGA